MLRADIKNIKSEKSDLRKFGMTVGIFLGLLAVLLWWREKDFFSYFLIISAALIILGLCLPSILKPLQRAWMTVAVLIGWFMTRVILCIMFYLVVTPIGLIAKLLGKDFLDEKFNRDVTNSYWIPKENKSSDKNSYEKQF